MTKPSPQNGSSPLEFPNLLSFWTFQEPAGQARVAEGPNKYRLVEGGKQVERVEDGCFGPYSARFSEGAWLEIKRAQCPALDIHGAAAQVTIVAWIKREKSEYPCCQAVAGMWNEHRLRQYCLFLNLRIHDSSEQAGAHVSSHGGATPGYKYCMDAAIGATPVPFGSWQCAAMTYDGQFARVYLNGQLDARGARNPFRYEGGLFDGGPNGADFTVGAVCRPERVDEDFQAHGSVVANPFYGLIGGLAVYDRALAPAEIAKLWHTAAQQ